MSQLESNTLIKNIEKNTKVTKSNKKYLVTSHTYITIDQFDVTSKL